MNIQKKIKLLLLLAMWITLLTDYTALSNQENTIELSELDIIFHLPMQIEDIQHYRDGGTIGVNIKDSKENNILFSIDGRLNTKTPQAVYIGAMHPSVEDARLVRNGNGTEKAIIKILRSWLKTKITNIGRYVDDDVNSKDQLAERFNVFIIVHVVNTLQKNFIYDPELFEPKYNCYDLHGGYTCWIETEKRERNAPSFNQLLDNFCCQTDADCHPTKDGGCITGNSFAELMSGQLHIGESVIKCRCLKGPVEYGCVPDKI